jgi:hypothetical protein
MIPCYLLFVVIQVIGNFYLSDPVRNEMLNKYKDSGIIVSL